MIALIASIAIGDGIDRVDAIGNVVVACCRLLQLRIAPLLTLCSQLRFLLVIKLDKGNYHSMIYSFYFIALKRADRLILIGEVVVCCRLVQPIVANETFSHGVFFDDQTNDLVKT
jgi:hypothetical protein